MTYTHPDAIKRKSEAVRAAKAVIAAHSPTVRLPLELALIRWSVVHRRWHEIGGDCPDLQAFLAGWFCRAVGASRPAEVGTLRNSFNCGWAEASDQITIEGRRR